MKQELIKEIENIKAELNDTTKHNCIKELIDNTLIAIGKTNNDFEAGFIAWNFRTQYYIIKSQPMPPFDKGGISSKKPVSAYINSEEKVIQKNER
jgi:hypothetical protein